MTIMVNKLRRAKQQLKKALGKEGLSLTGKVLKGATRAALTSLSAGAVAAAPASAPAVAALSSIVDSKIQKALKKEGMGLYRGSGMYRGSGAYRGSGEYVATNQLIAGSRDVPMKIASAHNETGNIFIQRREYLLDLFAPATSPDKFTMSAKLQANPGLPGIGPFVAQLASNYERYRYRQLVFSYNPVITDSSSTGKMGSVLFAFNMNAASEAFSTKQQMAEYDSAISVRICDPCVLGVECKNSEWLFVRSGSVPTGQDLKTYDFGNLQIATSGIDAAFSSISIGELWVDYTIELEGPKLYDSLGFSIPTDRFYGQVGCTSALILGTSPYKSSLNSLGGSVTKLGTCVYTFPDNFTGWVRFIISIKSSGGASYSTNTVGGNVTSFTDLSDSASTNNHYMKSTASQQAIICVFDYFVAFASSAGGNTLTPDVNAAVGVTEVVMLITQINSQSGAMFGNTSNYVAV